MFAVIAVTQDTPVIEWNGQSVTLDEVEKAYEKPLADIFPLEAKSGTGEAELTFTINTQNLVVHP